jgi:hypothetical protein
MPKPKSKTAAAAAADKKKAKKKAKEQKKRDDREAPHAGLTINEGDNTQYIQRETDVVADAVHEQMPAPIKNYRSLVFKQAAFEWHDGSKVDFESVIGWMLTTKNKYFHRMNRLFMIDLVDRKGDITRGARVVYNNVLFPHNTFKYADGFEDSGRTHLRPHGARDNPTSGDFTMVAILGDGGGNHTRSHTDPNGTQAFSLFLSPNAKAAKEWLLHQVRPKKHRTGIDEKSPTTDRPCQILRQHEGEYLLLAAVFHAVNTTGAGLLLGRSGGTIAPLEEIISQFRLMRNWVTQEEDLNALIANFQVQHPGHKQHMPYNMPLHTTYAMHHPPKWHTRT